jgi:hypothetical protein
VCLLVSFSWISNAVRQVEIALPQAQMAAVGQSVMATPLAGPMPGQMALYAPSAPGQFQQQPQ